jgi:TolA-binding protein
VLSRRACAPIATTLLIALSAVRADESAEARQSYAAATAFLRRGLNEAAVDEYRRFLAACPDCEDAALAHYGLAVALQRLGHCDEALAAVRPLAEREGFAFAPEATWIMAQCRLEAAQTELAIEALESLVARFPQHDLADDAGAALVDALYAAGRHEHAAAAAARFAERYADSSLLERVAYLRGLAEAARGRWDTVATLFEQYVRERPDGPFTAHAALTLGQACQQLGRLPEAARCFELALRCAEQRGETRLLPDVLLGLAVARAQSGETDAAQQALERCAREYPNAARRPLAQFHVAGALLEAGQVAPAAELLSRLSGAADVPQDQWAYRLGKCALRLGDAERCDQTLTAALAEFPQSPLRPLMTYDAAVARSRAGRPDAAARLLCDEREALRGHALEADALVLLASCAFDSRQFDAALSACREFLGGFASHERAPEVELLAAECLRLAGRESESIDSLRVFLERRPDHPRSGEAALRLGLELHEAGRMEEAISALKQVEALAEHDARFVAALAASADAQYALGAWTDAIAGFERYLANANATATPDVLLKLALCHERAGHAEAAARACTRLIAEHPESPQAAQARFELGDALLKLDRKADAAAAFEDLLRRHPETPLAGHAALRLARTAQELGDAAKAAEHCRRALEGPTRFDRELSAALRWQLATAVEASGDHAAAAEAWQAFAREHPEPPRATEAQARRGIALARLERCDVALAALDSAAADGEPALDDSLAARVQYERAGCLRRAGRDDEAADALRAVLRLDSHGLLAAHAALELAELEARAGRHEAAAGLLAPLVAAADGAGRIPDALLEAAAYRLAASWFVAQRFNDAAREFARFVERFPESKQAASAGYFAGEARFKTGDVQGAVDYLARAARQGNAELAEPALLRLAECHGALQRWPDAERVNLEYLSRFPTRERAVEARFGLAWSREQQKRFDEAIEDYRLVVAAAQSGISARAQFQIGECLFAAGRHEQAAAELLKVDILFQTPQWSAAALYEAGRCFEKLGQLAQAREQYTQVTTRFANTEWAKLADAALNDLAQQGPPGRRVGDSPD